MNIQNQQVPWCVAGATDRAAAANEPSIERPGESLLLKKINITNVNSFKKL